MTKEEERIDAANRALQTFAPGTRIERRPGGWYVCWTGWKGKAFAKRWATRGQDFYPVWHDHWGHGGTASMALSQLVRWAQEKPVLPIGSWRYWASERIQLTNSETLEILRSAGYPEEARCVLCGEVIAGGMDWWHLDGVTGPCCGMRSGCKQTGIPNA